jgi:hypothetical protein
MIAIQSGIHVELFAVPDWKYYSRELTGKPPEGVSMSARRLNVRILAALALVVAGSAFADTTQWSLEKANGWYGKQRWLIGANYLPANAINQLEMWQSDTFDAAQIEKELGWAQSIGMNTMRVFLHDPLWEQDALGFKKRIGEFLAIAEKHVDQTRELTAVAQSEFETKRRSSK